MNTDNRQHTAGSTPPSGTAVATRPVVVIVRMLERYLPPWLASILAGALTLFTQLHSFVSTFPAPIGYADALSRLAGSEDLLSLLPAPLAAVITYLIRRTPSPVPVSPPPVPEPLGIDLPGTAPAASTGASTGASATAPGATPAQRALARQALMGVDLDLDDTQPIRYKRSVSSVTELIIKLQADARTLKREVDRQAALHRVYEHTHLRTVEDLLTRVALLEHHHRDALLDAQEAASLAQDEPRIQPLNIRQNNPLNIEASAKGKKRWKGELPSTNRYACFDSPVSGIRAAAYLLAIVYYLRYDLQSVQEIIERWSPRGDNTDAEVDNYITRVCIALNVKSDAILSIDRDARQMVALIRAMGEVEGGLPLPYSTGDFYEAIGLLPDTPTRILTLKRSAQGWLNEYNLTQRT